MESDSAPNRLRWLLAGFLVMGIAAFYFLGLQDVFSWHGVRQRLDGWQAQTRDHLLLAVVVFFLIYVLATALSLPVGGMLSLVAGALFGLWVGFMVVSLAAVIGATLAFLSSRYLLRDLVQRRFGARLDALNEGIRRDGAYYLFLMRLVPVIPFFLINLGMGLTPMRVSTFAFVSWIGMLLGAFLYVNAGTKLGEITEPGDILSLPVLGSFALLGLVPLILRKLLRGRR